MVEIVVYILVDFSVIVEDLCRVFVGNSDGRVNWVFSVDFLMLVGEFGFYFEDFLVGRGWVVVGANLMERDFFIFLFFLVSVSRVILDSIFIFCLF